MPTSSNRTKWLRLRLQPQEHERLQRLWQKTTCRKLSDNARRQLLGKPLTVTYHNRSLDALLERYK